jgi:NAD(P)H-hydrate epimerase
MKAVTSREMREIDRITISDYGIGGLVLMERAGVAATDNIMRLYEPKRVTVLAGSGNNGGDGLVIARELHNRGVDVRVIMVGSKSRLSPDCRHQYDTARKMRVPIAFRKRLQPLDLHGALVVDAVFGTGLDKDVKGPIAGIIREANGSGCTVVAVDIASGISADNGQILGTAFYADTTVTFGAPKRGHLLYPGAEHTGRLLVEDIGFPGILFEHLKCTVLQNESMARLVPERAACSHKGDYGHVLLLAGSKGKTGAALLAARACLRTGAGLVTIGAPERLSGPIQSSVTEEMLLLLPDTGEGALSIGALDRTLEFINSQADVIAAGPGMGRLEETSRFVRELLIRSPAPMVLDADAAVALENSTGLLRKTKSPVILTPHPGEFSRLSGRPKAEIEKDRIGSATEFAKETGTWLVLKGAPTVVAEPGGNAFISSTGNPGMATAGSGDVLTGMIAALLGQGLPPLESSLLGVFLHGLAGDLGAGETGEHSLVASDIVETIPEALKHLRQ